MEIRVNGKKRTINESMTVSGLLLHLGVEPEGVAVEINRDIIPSTDHQGHKLGEGDRVEIVTFVGGG